MESRNEPNQADRTALAEALVETTRFLHAQQWAPGTGGNFSVVCQHSPLRLLITPSGVDKGRIRAEQLLEIDAEGNVLSGTGTPSAETPLHLAIVQTREAGAVLHTHSVWNTILSRHFAYDGGVPLQGYEMLKGLQGVKTHMHHEFVPILGNSQDMASLSNTLTDLLARTPACHGILLKGHGLYTWGANLFEARRHVEILEFLFEVVARETLRDGR